MVNIKKPEDKKKELEEILADSDSDSDEKLVEFN